MISETGTRVQGAWQTWVARVCYLLAGLWVFSHEDLLQSVIDRTYSYLLSTWVFNSVYFETWWATIVYAVLLFFPYIIDKMSAFDSFKIEPSVGWSSAGLRTILLEAVVYCTPLMTLDTFMVKRYKGVGIAPGEWDARADHWIQHTRALPIVAPTLREIIVHLAGSFILYDAMFYAVHLLLHKNFRLYKTIHAEHHQHDLVNSRVTNLLSVPERVVLVLSANQALKMFHSHPFTRLLFVPLFVGWLIENHCGYDFPWTLDKVVPWGLVGGSPAHYRHHSLGTRNYQPFFTYIDRLVEWSTERQKHSKNL